VLRDKSGCAFLIVSPISPTITTTSVAGSAWNAESDSMKPMRARIAAHSGRTSIVPSSSCVSSCTI